MSSANYIKSLGGDHWKDLKTTGINTSAQYSKHGYSLALLLHFMANQ